uniref:Uncharacterized protein n=1 Tax=Caenorhabditis tropicalis TaxID=1561998 RepID=A0A1I7U393_9PELO
MKDVHSFCTVGFPLPPCEARLKEYADTHPNNYNGLEFCTKSATLSTAPPVNQQTVQPQLTPEQQQELLRQQQLLQQQQQQQQLQMQQQMQQQQLAAFSTPSGFMDQNPGISIGIAVILMSGFCFLAAVTCSFLFPNEKKSPQNRGRRGNQIRKPTRGRNQRKTGNSTSKIGKEKKENVEEQEEKQEKTKSSYSKSKEVSKVSNSSAA